MSSDIEINRLSDKLQVVKLTPSATVPTKGSDKAAGYDLSSAYNYTLPAWGSLLIKTDLQIKVPDGSYGRVAPRSGLAWKNKIHLAGVIDADYRGPINIILFNLSNETFKINRGDRVAQLVCEKNASPDIAVVKSLNKTDRGEKGFGSSGITG